MRSPAKTGVTAIRRPFLLKGLAILLFLCIFIKAAASIAGAALSDGRAARLIQDENVAESILSFELGGKTADSLAAMLLDVPFVQNVLRESEASADAYIDERSLAPRDASDGADTAADINISTENDTKTGGGLFYGGESSDTTSVTPPPEDTHPAAPQTGGADSIMIDNTTDYNIDVASLLNEPLNITLTPDKPAVLIIHTHTSEAYTQSGSDTYEPSDPFRTEDKSKNVVRVGEELAAGLEARGISVIHDKRSYDYPSYTGSYNRTYTSVSEYLNKYPTIKLVLDIHRDSITASDGSQYKTIAQIGDETCSQIMFVVGSDAAGLTHPSWRENLKLALWLESGMNADYPSLARPVRISQYRYNQQLTPGALIVEVGCAGNTLEESLAAVRYFADSAAKVMLGLYG